MPDRCRSLRFNPGRLLITPGAMEFLERAGVDPLELLGRHLTGDWGCVCQEDREANNDATAHEDDEDRQARVLSAYETTLGRVWVITEADRSATTILLPDEY